MSFGSLNQLIASAYVKREYGTHAPNDVICLIAVFIPNEFAPGCERDKLQYPWNWDKLELATVSDGHRYIKEKDRNDAQQKEAKLTYGETLPCGVLKILDNLNASQKSSFHDLGMGTGKMVLQAYLAYPNLKRCVGVEIAQPRHKYAETHLQQLIEKGYKGRSFVMVEFMETRFFKIVEDVPNRTPKHGWRANDPVVAFHPTHRKSSMDIVDYNAIIVQMCGTSERYVVRYLDGVVLTVEEKYLFVPGTARVLEIWFGSLFDYPNAFNTDLCMLTADFPESKLSHLMECICRTPIGCKVFLYHNVMGCQYFPWNRLRRCDFNVYDNDRYACSWSQGWRFYIFEHIVDVTTCKIDDDVSDSVALHDTIFYWKKGSSAGKSLPLQYGEIVSLNGTQLILKTTITGPATTTISLDEYNVLRSNTKFRIGSAVSWYDFDKQISEQQAPTSEDFANALHYGTVIGVEYGFYVVVGGVTTYRIREPLVFHLPQMRFKVGDNVMALWPRNAQQRKNEYRMTRFRAQITEVNEDVTYALQYEPLPDDYFEQTYGKKEEKTDGTDGTAYDFQQKSYVPTTTKCCVDRVREAWISRY
eukprot:272908_1